MLAFLRFPLTLARLLWHLLIALFDVLLGRRRRRYEVKVLIKAPRNIVWQAVTARRYRVNSIPPLEVINEPLSGEEGLHICRVLMGGNQVNAVVYRLLEEDEVKGVTRLEIVPHRLRVRPLNGHDHTGGVTLRETPGCIELTLYNELTVDRFGARVTLPLALQGEAARIKMRCEGGAAPQSALRRYADKGALAIAAVLSFIFLMGWQEALLVTAIILLHELGHAAAMWMTGAGVGSISLIPFFGGVAVARRPSSSQAQQAFIALMGPGFSLIPTLGLLGLFFYTGNVYLLHAAALFAIINGLNLLPIFPLDGGQILNSFFASLSPKLASGGRWAGIAIGFGAAAYFIQSAVLCLFFGLMAVQLMISGGVARELKRLTPLTGLALLLAFLTTLGIYMATGVYALRMEQALDDDGRMRAAYEESSARPDFSCRMPQGSEAVLRRYLDNLRYVEGGYDFANLATIQKAGQGDLLREWMTPPPGREKREGVWAAWRYPDWLTLAQTRTVDDIAAETGRFPNEIRAELMTRVFLPAMVAFGRYDEAAALAAQHRHAGDRVVPAAVNRLAEAGAPAQAAQLLPFVPASRRAQLALIVAIHFLANRTGTPDELRASLPGELAAVASSPGLDRMQQAMLVDYLASAGITDLPLPAAFYSPTDDLSVTAAELSAAAKRAVFRGAGEDDEEARLAQENFAKGRNGQPPVKEQWAFHEALAQYRRALMLGKTDEARHIREMRLKTLPGRQEDDSGLEERGAELGALPARTAAERIAARERQLAAGDAAARFRRIWNRVLVEPEPVQAMFRLNLAADYARQGETQRASAMLKAAAADMCGTSRGGSSRILAGRWHWFWWRAYVINAALEQRLPHGATGAE